MTEKTMNEGSTKAETDTRLTQLRSGTVPDRCPRQTPRSTEVRKGIYVAGFAQYVKIGISTNVYERVAVLQTPEEMKVYAILDGWTRQERELHRRFAEYRLRGEWFRHEGELAKWVIKVSTNRTLNEGANNGRAKITEADVISIRTANGALQRELAKKFGVSRTQISNIRSGKNWANIS
jgi:DNA-binding XRE family transcriptional regulator